MGVNLGQEVVPHSLCSEFFGCSFARWVLVNEDVEGRETDAGIQMSEDMVGKVQSQVETYTDIRGVSFNDMLMKNSAERGGEAEEGGYDGG